MVANVFAFSAASADDLTIKLQTAGLRGGGETIEYVSGPRVRIHQGESDTIYDTATGRILTILHGAKEYYETSFQEIQARLAQFPHGRSATPTPEPQPITVVKAPSPKTVAGRECEGYTLAAGGLKLEVWLAPGLDGRSHAEARRLEIVRGDVADAGFLALYRELAALPGLALAERRFGSTGQTRVRHRREATEVRLGTLPPSTYEVPAGYRKRPSPYAIRPPADPR